MSRTGNSPASNQDWQKWGRDDPFWGVASAPERHRGGANPWTPAEFYQAAEPVWADFKRHWEAYGMQPGCALEIGCGAGRLTKAMAADFKHVIGVDVSDGMLSVAREHVTEANVEFRLGDGASLPAEGGSVDAIFSTHVFQHFESLDVARINFAEAARVLAPSGTVLIHLPTYRFPRGLGAGEAALGARRWASDFRANARRRRGRPVMRGQEYSWDWIFGTLPVLGFDTVELTVFKPNGKGDPHACVLARKRGMG